MKLSEALAACPPTQRGKHSVRSAYSADKRFIAIQPDTESTRIYSTAVMTKTGLALVPPAMVAEVEDRDWIAAALPDGPGGDTSGENPDEGEQEAALTNLDIALIACEPIKLGRFTFSAAHTADGRQMAFVLETGMAVMWDENPVSMRFLQVEDESAWATQTRNQEWNPGPIPGRLGETYLGYLNKMNDLPRPSKLSAALAACPPSRLCIRGVAMVMRRAETADGRFTAVQGESGLISVKEWNVHRGQRISPLGESRYDRTAEVENLEWYPAPDEQAHTETVTFVQGNRATKEQVSVEPIAKDRPRPRGAGLLGCRPGKGEKLN